MQLLHRDGERAELAVEDEVRVLRRLEDAVLSGEFGEAASAGAGIEALGVAAGAGLVAGLHIDEMQILPENPACALAEALARRDDGDEHDESLGRKEPRDLGDPPDVFLAVRIAEAEIAVQARAQAVPVEHNGQMAPAVQQSLHPIGDARLAGARKAEKPEDDAALPQQPLLGGAVEERDILERRIHENVRKCNGVGRGLGPGAQQLSPKQFRWQERDSGVWENRLGTLTTKSQSWASAAAALLLLSIERLPAEPIRPLAQEFVTVARSSDPQKVFLYNPALLRLGSGRLVASYEQSGSGEHLAHIVTSDDHGRTWTERASRAIIHGRLFQAGKAIYLLGHHGDLRIARSDDGGDTWSAETDLTHGENWHASACNVWHTRRHVYLAMEREMGGEIKGWPVGEFAPILMRAPESADLSKRESWTFASALPFCDTIRGYRQNAMDIDYFGVPFFPQNYPLQEPLPGRKREMDPMGWLETNVVQIEDPHHDWYDPDGHTFHLLMRAHTGGTGYAALAKVMENPDGTMTTSLVTVPSGKTMLYLPLPGGQMRFHILYDAKTRLYWLLSNQATDSMTRTDLLPASRFSLPNNERNRLVLHFSKNLVDWCFAGLVAIGQGDQESRNYACMDIDGDDLVILSRSGNAQAKSAHDGNLITFHRVKNFRDLVY